ncbi:type II 3-dehydroquinate dehydratase [Thalassobaculum sp.]|uniref:type II 3-dehydroquinate dehydratase n=1 Tax=Thalassobaculum sp. TaxID=2022740 RepID=UPI0032EAD221
MKVLVIQGANMEFLGRRQPELYGTTTTAELDAAMHEEALKYGLTLDIRYTNLEGEAIGWIYEAERGGTEGLLMNPAGFLYAGYALRDCIKAVSMPYVEVHMTNIDKRGMHSVLAEVADALITGVRVQSYMLGLAAMHHLLTNRG